MPLNLTDAVVHSNTGGVTTTAVSTAITVSLAGADVTEADNTLLVVLAPYITPGSGNSFVFTVPSGWVLLHGNAGTGNAVFYRGPAEGLAAGESSWNFTPASGTGVGAELAWLVFELSGIGAEPSEFTPAAQFNAGTGTVMSNTGTSGKTTSYDALWVNVSFFRDASSVTPATWGSHSNSFTEIGESGIGSGSHSVGVSVSARPVQVIGSYAMDATASTSFAANESGYIYFALTARNAPRQTDLQNLDGGEARELGTVTGNVTIDAAAARSGVVGYLLSSTAAACNKTFTTGSAGSYPAYRWCFRVPDLTDRSEIAYFTISVSGGTAKVLTLRMTSGQLGLVWSGGLTAGGEQLSDQSITANQWIGIDLRLDRRTALQYTVEWAVDYNAELTDTTPGVRQTAVTATSATGTFLSLTARVGWSSSLTTSMHVDDYGVTPGYNFPVGDLRVLPLKVDPSGTPSITGTGTTTNFGVMTANGTVAAWNATNARNAVDDIPVIGAGNGSRDAAVAILAHASDNASFPMETYALATNQVNVRGVRCHWWVWAASATATTLRVLCSDGTDTHTLFAEASPGASNTTIVYNSAVVRASSTTPPDWTQPKVDALNVQFGSNDANPDVGLDAMLLELAVVKALPESLFGEPGEAIYVAAHRDPATFALVGATVTNNSGAAVELEWDVSGTPDSSGSIPDGTIEQYVPISPDGTLETVGRVDLTQS